MNGNGPLDFDATIDTATFNRMLDEMERRLRGVGDTAVNEGNRIDDAFRNATAAVGAYLTLNFGKQIATEVGQVRGEFQQLELAFETMLKNKQLSDKLMADVVDFAAKTPFDLKGVAAGAKQLLAYGTEVQDIIPTMKRLGDVAAGLSLPFGDLVYLYGTSAVQGRVMTKDLMQFANRGIPVIDELSKILNVSKADILDLTSKGQIHFEHLRQVIVNLTEETGMFGGLMEKQSKTITGLVSNLGDAWDQMLNNIGKANEGAFESSIAAATVLVENYQQVLDILKVLVATVGAYKAGIILNTIAIKGYSQALGLATIKQNLLNIAQKASPWGLALAGITALVGGLYVYNRTLDDSGKKMQQFNETVSNSVSESNVLFDRLKKTTAGTQDRATVIRQLESIHGSYIKNLNLEKSALEDIEKAQRASNDELIRNLAIKSADEEKQQWYKKELDIIKQINAAGYDFNEILKERNNPQYNEYGRRIFVSYGQQVDALLANYEAVQAEKKRIDEVYQSIIEGFNSGLTLKPDDDFSNKIEEDKKTLSQKLKEIQQLYENYYRWAERYGKESADKQFKDLIKGGESFLEYLESRIKDIENKGVKTSQQRDDLSTYLLTRSDLIGEKTGFEKFVEDIESAKDRYKDLIDYIQFLKNQLNAVGAFDGSEDGYKKIEFLFEKLKEAEKGFTEESIKMYKEAVEKAADFAKRRLLIEQEYTDQVKKIDETTLGKEKFSEALEALKKLRDEKLAVLTEEEIKSGQAYKNIAGQIREIGRVEAQSYLATLEKQLKSLDDQSELYKEIKRLITSTKESLRSQTVDGINKVADGFREAARFAALFDEEVGNSLDGIAQLTSGIAQIASGNYLQGIIQSLTAIFTTVINSAENASRKAEETQQRILENIRERLSDINTLLEKQISLIDKLSGSDRIRAYGDSFKNLRNEIIGTLNQINNLEVTRKGFRGSENVNLDALIKTYRELFGNVRPGTGLPDIDLIERLISENRQAINDLYGELLRGDIDGKNAEELRLLIEQLETNTQRYEELKNRYNEYLTGTSAESLISSIVDGFASGKSAAEDFADNFEKLMKNAMLQALKMQALEIPLKQFYEQFASFAEDGLSSTEIGELRDAYNAIIGNAKDQWDQLQSILNISGSLPDDTNSLSGAIKGVTEETAGLIAGQMNAIRMNQAHALSLMDDQLAHLSEIASNTRYNRLLVDIKNILQSNSSNSSNQLRANGGT